MFGKKPANLDHKIDQMISDKLESLVDEVNRHHEAWSHIDAEVLKISAKGLFILDAQKFEACDSHPIDLEMTMDLRSAADNYNFLKELQIMRQDNVNIDQTRLNQLSKKYPLAAEHAADMRKLLIKLSDREGIEMQEMSKPQKK